MIFAQKLKTEITKSVSKTKELSTQMEREGIYKRIKDRRFLIAIKLALKMQNTYLMNSSLESFQPETYAPRQESAVS